MNKPEGFDDLVRRKLEERAFPFEEAHWLDAQRAILASERRKRPNGWWFAAPAALLIGLGVWWAQDSTDATVAAVPQVSAPEVQRAVEPEGTASTQPVVPMNERASDPITSEPSSVAAQRPAQESPVAEKPAENRTAKPAARSRENEPVAPKDGSDPIVRQKHGQAVAEPAATVATIEVVAKKDEPAPGASEDAQPITTKTDTDAAAKGLVVGATLVAEPGASGSEVAIEPTGTAAQEPPVQVADEPVVEGNSVDSLVATQTTTPDSALAIADSAATAPVPPAPPLVDAASPWEITAMAGILATSSRYQGGGSDAWNDAISSEPTSTYGAEFMHMGRNFGIGGGLHYSTYAERMKVEERSSTLIDIEKYWYLQPVSIDVLVITDTIDIQGVTYYVGETQNTMVNVLTQGADTTVTTTVLRAGRDQVNRTSYLEIPLLLDGHLTQGRWMFGLRGGPMLGVLTGRHGAVPNPTDDGYEEFTDQAFRSLIVGYTARAYIRYRFNSAWSIGVEPTIKGQLMDTYSSGDLSRRSAGCGGVLSLTYRLR